MRSTLNPEPSSGRFVRSTITPQSLQQRRFITTESSTSRSLRSRKPSAAIPSFSAVPFAAAWPLSMRLPAINSGKLSPSQILQNRKSAAGTQQFGPSGAAIWATPTIDQQASVLYVATGDNYSDPPTTTSDAVLAIDLKNGQTLWSKQLGQNDAYNNACAIPIPGNCPEAHGADSDFGQPPILVSLGSGKRLLVIAQKSGMVHAIDPDAKGKIVWQTRVGEGGVLGGSQWGSASDGENIYVAVSD
jgi:outer membrane protein assembly factor BamB